MNASSGRRRRQARRRDRLELACLDGSTVRNYVLLNASPSEKRAEETSGNVK